MRADPATIPFAHHLDRLARRLAGPLPGSPAQLIMAPTPRSGAWPPLSDLPVQDAAVLALFYPIHDEPTLVFIQRSPDIQHHPGQIAFPGGRLEPGETPEQAALRECHEEVGVDPASVRLLGRLSPLVIPHSGNRVTPLVGWTSCQPTWTLQVEEVAGVLEVPLSALSPTSVQTTEAQHGSLWMRVPYYGFQGHRIWGATAMMLSELLALYYS